MSSSKSQDQLYVDGMKIKKYVYEHISFTLPDHIYSIVDSIMAEFWSEIPPGACLYPEDFEEALCKLSCHDVLLCPSHIRCLSSLIMEAMHTNGYIEKILKRQEEK